MSCFRSQYLMFSGKLAEVSLQISAIKEELDL